MTNAASAKCQPVGFKSADGVSQIRGCVWLPEGGASAPRGIVQLVHGMAEHIGRYDHFARFLASKGFVVCGHDHIGHGKSAAAEDWGCLPPKDGKDILIADVHELRSVIQARHPRSTPYFMFGHSMGSFVVRAYVARHGEGLAGAVICGTGNQPLIVSKAGNALANLLCKTRGVRAKSKLLYRASNGSYRNAVKNARTENDWLSTDPTIADAYEADEMCGFQFTVGGYAALTSLTAEVVRPSCALSMPKNLPLLYIAGSDDPVGENGKGVIAASDLAVSVGMADVQMKIYEGMRHEILNEVGKEEVYADVLTWIEKRL